MCGIPLLPCLYISYAQCKTLECGRISHCGKHTLVSSADGERGDIDGLSFALYCYVHSNLTTGAADKCVRVCVMYHLEPQ